MSDNKIMKAVVYRAKEDIRLEERPVPETGSRDVKIKIARAGLCASDQYYYKYGAEQYGINPGRVIGHEAVGTIVECGSEVPDSLQVGMRVFIDPNCCRLENMPNPSIIGTMTEYIVVKNAELNHNLFILPDDLPFSRAVATEPYSVAVGGVTRAELKDGDHVVVLGGGPIGLFALDYLHSRGFQDVVVADVRKEALAKIADMGGTPVNPMEVDLREFLTEHFGTAENFLCEQVPDVDAYLDYCGIASYPAQILNMGKQGGKHVIISGLKTVEYDLSRVMCLNFKLIGSVVYDSDMILSAIQALNRADTKADDAITHVFPLDKVEEAFLCAVNRTESFKVALNVSD